MITVYLHPNVDSVFLYWLFCWIFLHNFSLTLYCFWCIIMETIISSIPTFHGTNNHNMSKMKWQFFNCGNVNFIMKDIYNFLLKNKTYLRQYYSSLVCVRYDITQLIRTIISNFLNLCIKYLDMFWNIWNLILSTEARKKQSSYSDDYKYGAFILGQSEEQFKLQSHFVTFDPVTG